MTNTSKFGRVAGIVGTTATTYAKGSAGIGFALAQRGYGLARHEIARRQAASALKPPSALKSAGAGRPAVSVRTRRIVVFGGLAAVVAGIAVLARRRHHEIAPPADAPPSLADYADSREPAGERVNGSTPAQTS